MYESLNEPPTLVHKYPEGYSDGEGENFIQNDFYSFDDEIYVKIL